MAALGLAMPSDAEHKPIGNTVFCTFATYVYYRIERAFDDQTHAVEVLRKEQLLKRMLCKDYHIRSHEQCQ